MANIEERTLTLVYGTTKNYFSGFGLYIDYRGWSNQPMAIWGTKQGTATMLDAGKAILYPKAGVHPIKADLSMIGATSVNGAIMTIAFDGVEVFSDWWYNNSQEETKLVENLTNECILNSTINSSITVTLSASQTSLFGGFGMRNNSYFKLYFQQWDLTAQKVGDGWGTVTVPGRVYDNESVNYTCIIGNGCTFHGWYSDVAHTNLVSSDTTYTITASQDLVLYAYITRDVLALNNVYTKTNFHLGENAPGWFKPYKIWYKTLNGWEAQSNTNNLIAGNTYRYSDNFIQTFDLANIDSSLVNPSDSSLYSKNFTVFYYPWEHGTIYVKNSNNYIIRNITMYSKSYFIQPMQDNSFIIHYNGEYSSLIQSIHITYQETISDEIKTFIFNIQFTTFERDIQFKNLNGNLYKEKLICTSPFTVTTPSGSEYNGFTGWKEIYCGTPTGRILQLNESYWDVGWNNEIYYEPIIN